MDEFFCVRYRNDRVYLLDYARNVNQEFSVSQSAMENGSLLLGVTGRDCQVEQAEGETDKRLNWWRLHMTDSFGRISRKKMR